MPRLQRGHPLDTFPAQGPVRILRDAERTQRLRPVLSSERRLQILEMHGVALPWRCFPILHECAVRTAKPRRERADAIQAPDRRRRVRDLMP